ncbi:MucR family transcriptional regulator (plasmid) [Novosphingobium sp. BL-8A]|uniref:MucR family transcriptional regulator n=1 Tax=Novosphingobium sp. BL-8A TaxID=3127639 RepID=UPI00375766CB
MMKEVLLELTSDIVTAHVTNNSVSHDELPQLIETVYGSLADLGKEPVAVEEERIPATSIRSSVKSDVIICLECGAKQKTLKRHLKAQHDLTPEEYRSRWKLPSDYPMVTPDYAARRSEMAKEIGLGQRGGRRKAVRTAADEAGRSGGVRTMSRTDIEAD